MDIAVHVQLLGKLDFQGISNHINDEFVFSASQIKVTSKNMLNLSIKSRN